MTWWVLLLTVSAAFASGWVAYGWQCSRRRDCPRYAEYALAKWKRDVEAQVARKDKRRRPPELPGDSEP